MTLTKTSFERIYRSEQDAKTRERMLLVLNVVFQGMAAAHVARDLHRCKAWASNWLKRYDEEGIGGLRDRPKSGRHSQIPEQTEYKIKTMLKESNSGWTTKQVEELIIKMSGKKHYHHIHIYRILRRWGFRQKVPRKVHVNTATREEKNDFKKRPPRYLWVNNYKKEGFTIVSLDESFFFYDSLVRRVFWIDEKKRPVARVTGSHNIHSCLFGAINMEGKQLFRHYGRFNGDTFLDFLRIIHHKFPRCHLFMDKAVSPHYRSRKVRESILTGIKIL